MILWHWNLKKIEVTFGVLNTKAAAEKHLRLKKLAFLKLGIEVYETRMPSQKWIRKGKNEYICGKIWGEKISLK